MIYFFLAFGLSLLFTWLVGKIAKYFGIVDRPDIERKKHSRPVPLLGGVGIFLAFWLVTGYLACFTNFFEPNLSVIKIGWVFLASVPLLLIGYFDDKYKVRPLWRLLISIFCVVLVIFGGVGLNKITNPLGGVLPVSFWLSNILVFCWVMGMMYTVKILDGLDGLATGITTIGSLMIFFIANGDRWHQPDVALWALVLAGACLGFLFFNFYPAKIFLGEGGGLFIGFMLGIFSVIAGGKIATALLVMALPILDLARVLATRFYKGRKIWTGDREHLHYKLLDFGLSQRQTVLLFYLIAFVFGITTLFLQSAQKIFALIFLLVIMLGVGIKLGQKNN